MFWQFLVASCNYFLSAFCFLAMTNCNFKIIIKLAFRRKGALRKSSWNLIYKNGSRTSEIKNDLSWKRPLSKSEWFNLLRREWNRILIRVALEIWMFVVFSYFKLAALDWLEKKLSSLETTWSEFLGRNFEKQILKFERTFIVPLSANQTKCKRKWNCLMFFFFILWS